MRGGEETEYPLSSAEGHLASTVSKSLRGPEDTVSTTPGSPADALCDCSRHLILAQEMGAISLTAKSSTEAPWVPLCDGHSC